MMTSYIPSSMVRMSGSRVSAIGAVDDSGSYWDDGSGDASALAVQAQADARASYAAAIDQTRRATESGAPLEYLSRSLSARRGVPVPLTDIISWEQAADYATAGFLAIKVAANCNSVPLERLAYAAREYYQAAVIASSGGRRYDAGAGGWKVTTLARTLAQIATANGYASLGMADAKGAGCTVSGRVSKSKAVGDSTTRTFTSFPELVTAGAASGGDVPQVSKAGFGVGGVLALLGLGIAGAIAFGGKKKKKA